MTCFKPNAWSVCMCGCVEHTRTHIHTQTHTQTHKHAHIYIHTCTCMYGMHNEIDNVQTWWGQLTITSYSKHYDYYFFNQSIMMAERGTCARHQMTDMPVQ